MSQRGYAIAFLLVLVAACIGAAVGGRFLYQRLTGGGLAAEATTVVQVEVTQPPALVTDVPGATPFPTIQLAPGGTATGVATRRLVLTPFVPPTPTFEPTATEAPATPTPAESPTPEFTATPVSAFPFVLTHAVRNSTGDCSGNLVLGQVTDGRGNGLPDVRLRLTDEFGSVDDTKATKSGASELGRYDFPVFGPGRRFFLQVVDANGRPLSDRVVIEHGVGAQAKDNCHWVDWTRK